MLRRKIRESNDVKYLNNIHLDVKYIELDSKLEDLIYNKLKQKFYVFELVDMDNFSIEITGELISKKQGYELIQRPVSLSFICNINEFDEDEYGEESETNVDVPLTIKISNYNLDLTNPNWKGLEFKNNNIIGIE